MTDLAEAAAVSMDQGLQDTQRHQDNFARFLERDVRAQGLLNAPPTAATDCVLPRTAAQEKENDEWKDLQELMETVGQNRLSIKLDNVRDFDPEMYDDCLNRPSRVIPAYERALNELVRALMPTRCPDACPLPSSAHSRGAVVGRLATWTRPTECKTARRSWRSMARCTTRARGRAICRRG